MRCPIGVLFATSVGTMCYCNTEAFTIHSHNLNQRLSARIINSNGLVSSLLQMRNLTSTTEAVNWMTDDKENRIDDDNNNNNTNLLSTISHLLGDDGIYHLTNPADHAALLESTQDKIVVLKVFAPWCRACKGLEPKFQNLTIKPDFNTNVPIVWASLSVQHNKAFVQGLGVLALPTVQFYVRGKLMDTFPCGPSKVPLLKEKLTALIVEHVDTDGTLKVGTVTSISDKDQTEEEEVVFAAAKGKKDKDHLQLQDSDAEIKHIMSPVERKRFEQIPYFSTLSLAERDEIIDNAVFRQFEPGSILMREGRPGRTFYVIQSGEVEICQRTALLIDPLVAQPEGYLGSVVNSLGPGDFFGERALITGEPRAASLRVGVSQPVTLWAMDQDVFPASCVLSGKSKNTVQSVPSQDLNEKYGVELWSDFQEQVLSRQLWESSRASQVRGSVNTPHPLASDIDDENANEKEYESDWRESVESHFVEPTAAMVSWTNDDAIFSLLTRFQMIRHVSQCFRYIQETRAVWGDSGSRNRRNMLVARLSKTQRAEFAEIFSLIDANGDGYIELNELKRVMESIGEEDAVLRNVLQSKNIIQAGDDVPHSTNMTFEDYMGLCAEAEFFNLFMDIFSSLDEQSSGFVKARELDRVLCGVRDLISDDRKSVIDVEDKDMLVDYELFARMLLGTTLI